MCLRLQGFRTGVGQVTDVDVAVSIQILHGDGLLGRESGLYGAVSFAYQG